MATPADPPAPWHALDEHAAAAALGADPRRGLSADEAAHRLHQHGRNELTARRGRGPLLRFLQQFHAPLVYILIIAAIIAGALGEHVDAGVILGVVIVNAIVGFIQESKALQAIHALSRSMTTTATVLRDGRKAQIPAAELVPGDVVLLAAGDKAPADLRLIECRELHADESALTGESVPVAKAAAPVPEPTLLADRRSMAYASSLLTRGQGRGLVVATGDATEVGRISGLLDSAADLETPLTRKLAEFSRLLLFIILAVAAATFLIGVLRGQSWVQMFMAAVALAVGAIPEGLPAAMTIMLAVGVSRMAARRAIIRRLPAVETLGSTTVICSDKTGTLTQNQMTVQAVFAGGEHFEITGAGYAPEGQVHHGGAAIDPAAKPALVDCFRAGALCNDASLTREADRWTIQGDPTEAALLVAAHKAGLAAAALHPEFPRLDEIPFESDRLYMATLHSRPGERPIVYLKGSAERLMSMCTTALDARGHAGPLDPGAVHAALGALSARGLRTLAMARLEPADDTRSMSPDALAGLTFLGIQGMLDPPRPEAVRAIEQCREAGIRVKMITGDHAGTAVAIAATMNLDGGSGQRPPVLTGADLASIPDEQLPNHAESTAVFARMTPEQKLRLVRALQSRGHIVAMTGDGVNDAPALRQADIGIAMGITGTEVAKEAADMVLADDNFASIEAAVEEGRGVFDNLTKFIVWELPSNGGEALMILASIAAGLPLPILPVQALYINLTTSVLLGMPLVFEPRERGAMARPPRDPAAPLFTHELIMRTGLMSLLLLAGGLGLHQYELGRGQSEAAARTAAVSVIVFGQMFYLFNCRSLTRSVLAIGPFSTPFLWLGVALMTAVQLAFAHTPLMNRLFQSAPLEAATWLRVLAISASIAAVVAFEKWIRFHTRRDARP